MLKASTRQNILIYNIINLKNKYITKNLMFNKLVVINTIFLNTWKTIILVELVIKKITIC